MLVKIWYRAGDSQETHHNVLPDTLPQGGGLPTGGVKIECRSATPSRNGHQRLPPPTPLGNGAQKAAAKRRCQRGHLITAAPTFATTSSWEPAPPETPIAPMSFPFSTSGIPPREAMTPSSVVT